MIDVEQGTPEWLAVRAGKPTASNFVKILTKSLKPSTQDKPYLARLVAECVLGHPLDEASSGMMERGTEMEDEAREWYEISHNCDVEQVGFAMLDDYDIGASVDGLVGLDGTLEIKCRGAAKHVAALLGHTETADILQTQGGLWVTDRKWCDVVSFCPEFPKHCVRQWRDEQAVKPISVAVIDFDSRLRAAVKKIEALRGPV